VTVVVVWLLVLAAAFAFFAWWVGRRPVERDICCCIPAEGYVCAGTVHYAEFDR